MKKLVLLATALTFSCLTFSALGQSKKPVPAKMPLQSSTTSGMSGPTSQGKWLVGASFGAGSSKTDNAGAINKNSYLTFQPAVSYFIQDDLALGVVLGVGSWKTTIASVDDLKMSTLFVAPSVRYYMPITERFKFFGLLLVPIGSEKQTLLNGAAVDLKTQVMGVELIPGFAFFPSRKISIEMNLGALSFQTQKTGDVKTNILGVSMLGENIFPGSSTFSTGASAAILGVKFHLGK